MKQITSLIFFLCILMVGNLFGQQEKGIQGSENWLNFWTEFKPFETDHGAPTQIITGDISKDTKLYKKEIYLLLGDVFITNNAALTIEPGTLILADYKTQASLTITKGASIFAEGTQTDPIVFTSNRDVNKKGDWGGIFILGDAPINKIGIQWGFDFGLKTTSVESTLYGGNNIESSSGVMRFVRIEYAGKRTKDYGYFNSLTLGGVGNKTTLENIMVSHSAGNSFYVLGGNVNLEKLVSFRASGNDFKFGLGAHVSISNSLAVRSPYVSRPGGASSIYITSHSVDNEVDIEKGRTTVDAHNLTLLNLSKTLEVDINIGLVKEAVYIDKDASLTMGKSVISGFNPAVILDNSIPVNYENLTQIKFSKMYFNKCRGNIFTKDIPNNEDLENWYGNRSFFNVYSKGSDSETFIDPNNQDRPDFRLRINKIIALEEMERG
jgi:hypothetical protein